MPDERPPLMDPQELRDSGYLQEVNRVFFHPLGLALALDQDADGHLTLLGVLDSRDDPEGFVFVGQDTARRAKAEAVALERAKRLPARRRVTGTRSGIQSLEDLGENG